jgi:8-hydroxy-5-deazaflavin:NADPH oxidoreductase
MRIAIVGGTGREGRGLALRWAKAGHAVSVGSRDAERAKAYAVELSALGFGTIEGGDNAAILKDAEVVLLSVPYPAHGDLLRTLRPHLEGRIVIDITVPLQPPRVREVHIPAGQAAALEAQEILGDGIKVVATLHHVSSIHLADAAHTIDCDVLVCSNHDDARAKIIALLGDLGLRGLDAGSLRNAVALEALTPVLLHLNKKYAVPGVGIRFTGLP